jgi:hypothetical protein
VETQYLVQLLQLAEAEAVTEAVLLSHKVVGLAVAHLVQRKQLQELLVKETRVAEIT